MFKELEAALRETRREVNGLRGENEALRFQSALREEEFNGEEKERRRTQAELQRVRAQLQQLQRQAEEQVCILLFYRVRQKLGLSLRTNFNKDGCGYFFNERYKIHNFIKNICS